MQNDSFVDQYPLTALQEGMLFHQLSEGGKGVDIEQISITLNHAFDCDGFIAAWNEILARHPILRTSFEWTASQGPKQCVAERVQLPVSKIDDWSNLSADEFGDKINQFQQQDRLQDFDLATPPLMRLAIISGPNESTVCLWTFHHILLDGRSFPLLLRELFDLYDGTAVESVAPERRNFVDFVQWLQNRDSAAEEEFWRQEMQGVHGSIPLQFDSSASSNKLEYSFSERFIDAKASAKLQLFAKEQGVTLNSLLQTAWALLLHHYTRETDIVFGSTRACRHGSVEGAGDMIGLLINTVPFRVRLDEQVTLSELLKTVRAKHLQLRDYEFTPLQNIRKIAGINSDMLFESIVVFDSASLNARMQQAGGRYLQREFNYRGQTNFPLALIAYGGEQLQLRIEYDCSQFSAQIVEGLLGQLQVLLCNFREQSHKPAVEVEYLSAAEFKAIIQRAENSDLDIQNATTKYESDKNLTSIHSLFEQQAGKNPELIALSYEQQNYSYLELNRLANIVAHRLIEEGVKPGNYIGLCFERSPELIIGLLAILKAGAAYVPLDPNYPQERLSYIIEDAGLETIVSCQAVANKIPPSAAKIVATDNLDISVESINPKVSVAGTDIAYIIYTSGSTGKPKGVKVRHENVCRLFHATDHWFHFNEQDVWTLFHSTAFDFSVWEIWGALIYGGRLVVVPYWLSRSPEKFYQLVLEEKVTVLNQTPSAFRQFIEIDGLQAARPSTALRYVIFGGEALDLQSLKPWFQRHGDQQPSLVNMYGITETTVHVTYRPITNADVEAHRGSVIGVPIPDLNLYLLNDYLNPVPPGVVGEIYVGGAGVTDGYLNRPQLTQERFIKSPFDGQRLYKSGDLARYLHNGELEYLGRSDFQVKVRGFRIETGEIEAELQKHSYIKQAIVDVYKNDGQEGRLLAYLLYEGNDSLTVSEIRDHLLQTLPDYMVPSLYMPIDHVPLTHNGKIDKRALPEPEANFSSSSPYMAPRTEAEKLLAQVWSRVLNREKIGINDNFFDLGGDSILTIKIVSALREQGYSVAPKQIFKAKTVAGLAAQLVASEIKTLPQDKVVGEVALNAVQRWFFDKEFEQANYWNQTFLFDLSESLNLDSLQRALSRLANHHDVLRARYRKKARHWQQEFVDVHDCFGFHVIDLSSAGESESKQIIEDKCRQLQAGLDIEQGPVWLAAYFSSNNGVDKLLLCAHHLIIDGVSWGIMLQDLETLYKNEQGDASAKLPLKTLSLAAWTEATKTYVNCPRCEQNLAYWNTLSSSQAQRLPLPVLENNYERDAAVVQMKLDVQQTTALLSGSNQAYNSKINDLLLVAFMQAMKQWLGISKLIIDMEGHGREELFENSDVSRTLGWFTSIYPLLLDLDAELPLKQQIQSIKEQLRKLPNQGFDYINAQYLRDSQFLPDIAQAQIMFNYLGQFDQTVDGLDYFKFAQQNVGPWHGPDNQRSHTLELVGMVQQGCLQFDIHYNQKFHDGAQITQFADIYRLSLIALIDHCTSVSKVSYTPSDFPLVSISQKELDGLCDQQSVAGVYPLSPMQKLFHTADLMDPAHGFEQWYFELNGDLDVERYQQAWQAVVNRHDILRTAVVELENGDLAQVVAESATLQWHFHDQSGVAEQAQQNYVDELRSTDRSAHFQLNVAPLLRVNLIKLADNRYQLLWSTHHLCIDGWSWPLVFADISRWYKNGRWDAPQIGQYGDYIAWLDSQSFSGMEAYWQEYLSDYKQPILFEKYQDLQAYKYQQKEFVLGEDLSRQLEQLATDNGVTLNTLFQGLWACVLGAASNVADVVFGISSSGRPADIAGVEAVVGPFVNNIPKRISLAENGDIEAWLQSIQESSMASVAHEYASPVDIQKYCGLPLNQRLFETLLVFQNYELPEQAGLLQGGVALSGLDLPQATNYPLTLVVVPGNQIRVVGYFQSGYFSNKDVQYLFADLEAAITSLVKAQGLNDLVQAIKNRPQTWQIRRRAEVVINQTASASDLANASATEKLIAGIWAKAFGVQAVDLKQSFFDMGGQSVMLVSIHGEMQKALNRRFAITQFFRHPSVSALAKALDGEDDSSVDRDAIRQKAQLKKAALRNAQRKKKARIRK